MPLQTAKDLSGGIFITFPGSCEKALSFYRSCFGGTLFLETFDSELPGITGRPVVRACLHTDRITIYGSDLVHDEGRQLGNYMSVYLPCIDADERRSLMRKLSTESLDPLAWYDDEQQFVELTDAFGVRWMLSI